MRVIGLPSVHSINSLKGSPHKAGYIHVIATLKLGLRAPLVTRNIIMISFIQVSCNLSMVLLIGDTVT